MSLILVKASCQVLAECSPGITLGVGSINLLYSLLLSIRACYCARCNRGEVFVQIVIMAPGDDML